MKQEKSHVIKDVITYKAALAEYFSSMINTMGKTGFYCSEKYSNFTTGEKKLGKLIENG